MNLSLTPSKTGSDRAQMLYLDGEFQTTKPYQLLL
ncbi:hypothetical protein Xen7305DRAFT_00049060 [Xenococcus sp. PCC 7305]|nr:hypothetical protein Xen7305DRAFT_00049060 [Xenococcus sp. PCC 7305]